MHLDSHPLLQKRKKPTFNILNNIKYVVPQNKFFRRQPIEFKQIILFDDQRWVWDQILALLETAPESRTLAALNVTRPQLEAERRRRQSQTEPVNKDDAATHPETIDFCEVKQRKPESSTGGLVYKPAESFSTTTSVVEVYRPDGMLMKIHICTERFSELLSAFFKA